MRIANIDNRYNKPQFQALIIKQQAIPALRKKGQAFINRLATAGEEFKDYKHFDMRIEGDTAKPIIASKNGKTIYEKLFHVAIPFSNSLVISTKIGQGENKGKIDHFTLDFDNKSEALNAYKQIVHNKDNDHTDYAIEITKFLEKEAIKKEENAKKVDTSCLQEFITTD